MSKEFTLTKEEFIERSMKGEVFITEDNRYFYDPYYYYNPFRINNDPLGYNWSLFNGKILFTLEEPEPIIERRWRWFKDDPEGYTSTTLDYMSDECAARKKYKESGWYKSDQYIDVEIKP